MSTQDLNRVHRRYIIVSNTFKSAWTFHQFIQGLRKVFPEVPISQEPADFQSVYGDLKQVSENLSETSVGTASAQLEEVETRLLPLIQQLLIVDSGVSPALLRQLYCHGAACCWHELHSSKSDPSESSHALMPVSQSWTGEPQLLQRGVAVCVPRLNSMNSLWRKWTALNGLPLLSGSSFISGEQPMKAI